MGDEGGGEYWVGREMFSRFVSGPTGLYQGRSQETRYHGEGRVETHESYSHLDLQRRTPRFHGVEGEGIRKLFGSGGSVSVSH